MVLIISTALIMTGCGGDPDADPAPSIQETPARDFFTDETRQRGIEFVQRTGWTGKRYMPEMLGSGGALFDFDNDGDLDLLLVNGGPLPGWNTPIENALYRNDGTGHFEAVAEAGGMAEGMRYGVGCAVADVDLDGDLDVHITNWGEDRLYLNDGRGHFEDATNRCGIDNPLWGASAAFGDVNGDGLPDLYVSNYLKWDIRAHTDCYQGTVPIYCGPQPFDGEKDILYINQGGGVFRNMTDALVGAPPTGKGLGVVMVDYDHDGDLDIYVANDETPNLLLQNDGKGRFTDVADFAGVAVSKDAAPEAGMGVAFSDFDNDLLEDILVTNFEDQVNSVYKNEGDGFFLEMSFESGIGFESRPLLGWGIGLIDFNHDGWKDCYYANGHIYDKANDLSPDKTWPQANRLHLNTGDGRFGPGNAVGGKAMALKTTTRGVAFGDIDNDGDVDIVAMNLEATPNILINNGAKRNWLMVTTAHPDCHTPVLGARIVITVDAKRQCQTIQGSYSFLTHNDTRVHFGLGDAGHVDSIEVTWVGGKTESYGRIDANRLVVLTPDGGAEVRSLKTGKTLGSLDKK